MIIFVSNRKISLDGVVRTRNIDLKDPNRTLTYLLHFNSTYKSKYNSLRLSEYEQQNRFWLWSF